MKGTDVIVLACLAAAVGWVLFANRKQEGWRKYANSKGDRPRVLTTKAGRQLKCNGGIRWRFVDKEWDGSCPSGSLRGKTKCAMCRDGHYETNASMEKRGDMFANVYSEYN